MVVAPARNVKHKKFLQSMESGILVRPSDNFRDKYFLFSEDDRFKKVWTVLILGLVVFTSILIPIQFGFPEGAERQMSTHTSSTCIGSFHHNASTGCGGTLTSKQRHETTGVNIAQPSTHKHVTTRLGGRGYGGSTSHNNHNNHKENGTCTILLASANDDERTLAVLECLTYEGRTLTEISNARFIPRAEFLENYANKNVAAKAQLEESCDNSMTGYNTDLAARQKATKAMRVEARPNAIKAELKKIADATASFHRGGRGILFISI